MGVVFIGTAVLVVCIIVFAVVALRRQGAPVANAGLLVEQGLSLLDAGKKKEAADRFRAATEVDPRHAQAWFSLGTAYASLGQHDLAVECYRNSAEHAPADKKSLPLYNLGVSLQELGKFAAALEAYTRATTVNPDDADAWINRGRLLDDCGRHLEAIESYDKALALAPRDVVALTNRGNSLRSLRRFEEAMASYRAALLLEPNAPAGLAGLGACLGQLGQPEQGLTHIDKALAAGRWPPILAERAIVLAQLERHEEALAMVNEVIRGGIHTAEVFNNRAEILAKLGRPEDAIKSFDEALLLDEKYAPALFGKARVFCNSGQFASAKKTIDLYFKYSDGKDGLTDAAHALVSVCKDAGAD